MSQPDKASAARASELPIISELPDSWPDAAKHEVWRLDAVIARYQDALIKIAQPERGDGTYNLSREACEEVARKALGPAYDLPLHALAKRALESFE